MIRSRRAPAARSGGKRSGGTRSGKLGWPADSPYAAVGPWLLLGGLLLVDVALVKPMVARAEPGAAESLNWIVAVGASVAIAWTLALAAEFWMRYRSGESIGMAWGAVCLASVWVAAIVVSGLFRQHYFAGATAAVPDGGSVRMGTAPGADAVPASAQSGGEWRATALFTVVLALSGLIAAAMAVLFHDDLQKQRRVCGRRLHRLRLRQRIALAAADRESTAAADWQTKIEDVVARTELQQEKLPRTAERMEQLVRIRMATAFGDPAATTGVMRGPAAPGQR